MTRRDPTVRLHPNPTMNGPTSMKEDTMHSNDQLHPAAASPARRPWNRKMRQLATLGVIASAGIAFAACGGSSGASSTTTTAPSTAAAGGNSSTTPSSLPGANGTIAAVTGTSLEVQNTETGQTTVNYTPTTTIRQTTSTTLSAVSGKLVTKAPS